MLVRIEVSAPWFERHADSYVGRQRIAIVVIAPELDVDLNLTQFFDDLALLLNEVVELGNFFERCSHDRGGAP